MEKAASCQEAPSHRDRRVRAGRFRPWIVVTSIALVLAALIYAENLAAREKDAAQYGMGLIVNLPFPEAEVSQVVQDVIQNGIIRGTKEYNNDEYVSGATPVSSTHVFPEWTEGGKVFYKVRLKAIDPRNFKDGGDVGTLAVRYVVQAQGDKNTVLHIDARFVEDFRRTSHPSNGSVESAEYKDIHDHLDQIEVVKAETVEALKEKQQATSKSHSAQLREEPVSSTSLSSPSEPSPEAPAADVAPPENAPAATTADPSATPQTLDQQVHDLRRQVQRLVKQPGAPLKSAPFHTATTLQSLSGGTEVLVVISTPYWLGIETHEGQHGWMLRDDLELIP